MHVNEHVAIGFPKVGPAGAHYPWKVGPAGLKGLNELILLGSKRHGGAGRPRALQGALVQPVQKKDVYFFHHTVHDPKMDFDPDLRNPIWAKGLICAYPLAITGCLIDHAMADVFMNRAI